MIRLHNNQVEVLEGNFNKTTNEFTFQTDKFSTYGIVYKDTKNSSGSSGGSGGSGGVVIPVREVSIELEKTTLTKKGESVTLNVKVEPSYATYKKLEWSSSDPDIATVDENGTVTVVGNKSGTVTITAKSINGKTVSVTITVELEPDEDEDGTGDESGDGAGDKPGEDESGDSSGDKPGEDESGDNTGDKPGESESGDNTGDKPDKDDTGNTKVTVDTRFATMRLKFTKSTKTTNTISWVRVPGADGYVIYGSRCNTKAKTYQTKQLKVIKDGSITSYKQTGLKSGTYYKYYVKAYKLSGVKRIWLTKSKMVHSVTKGGKYGNAESIKVNKSSVSLKVGKSFAIKAEEIAEGLPIKKHEEIQFESSNSRIAAVTGKGVIKAKKKGTCYIYVYAKNGRYKRIKVTVK